MSCMMCWLVDDVQYVLPNCTTSNRRVSFDGLVRLLADEDLFTHSLKLWDPRGASHREEYGHIHLVDTAVTQALYQGGIYIYGSSPWTTLRMCTGEKA
jgi:hypothetical protein